MLARVHCGICWICCREHGRGAEGLFLALINSCLKLLKRLFLSQIPSLELLDMAGSALNAAFTHRGAPAFPSIYIFFPCKTIFFIFVDLLGKFLFLSLTLTVFLAAQ